jgi:hypothetical protein
MKVNAFTQQTQQVYYFKIRKIWVNICQILMIKMSHFGIKC